MTDTEILDWLDKSLYSLQWKEFDASHTGFSCKVNPPNSSPNPIVGVQHDGFKWINCFSLRDLYLYAHGLKEPYTGLDVPRRTI